MENSNQFREFSGSSWNFQNCLPGDKMNFRSFQSFQKNKWPPCKTCDEFDFHVEVRQGSMIILLLLLLCIKLCLMTSSPDVSGYYCMKTITLSFLKKKDELQQKLRTWKKVLG